MKRSNDYYHELTIDEINIVQERLLDIFLEFKRICEKYKLQYYLVFGSLLGAVRHKGFIPWDDDLDVGMPLKDYLTFLKIAQKELPENLFLQTLDTDPNYVLPFAKIVDTSKVFEQFMDKHLHSVQGAFIDIFPLVGRSRNKFFAYLRYLREITMTHRQRTRCLVPSSVVLSRRKMGVFEDFLSILKYPFIKDKKLGYKIQKSLLKKDPIDSRYVSIGWAVFEYPGDIFKSSRKLSFCGIDVEVPANYDLMLKMCYGDYMSLPPENLRIPHHYLSAFDIETFKK